MPYEYIRAQCMANTAGAQWSEPDLKYSPLNAVFDAYSGFFLVLYHSVLQRQCFVDMNTQRSRFASYAGTIEQWLVDNSDSTLPEVGSIADPTIRFVKYANAIQHGYKLNLVNRNFLNKSAPEGVETPDLALSRPTLETNLELIHTHCLVTVAGFVHNTDADGRRVFVLDAGAILKKKHQAHVGIISFLDVGSVKKVKIKPEQITRLDVDTPLFEKTVFTTEEDITGKSVILCLGGYLIFPKEDLFYRVGINSFAVNIQNTHYIERVLESNEFLDLTPLGLVELDNNEQATTTEYLTSDDVVRKYFTLSQSFLIIVDTPSLVVESTAVEKSRLPGNFWTRSEPYYPLMVGHGRLPAYWKIYESGSWALRMDDNYMRNYTVSHRPIQHVRVLTDFLSNTRPSEVSSGYMLKISTNT